MKTYIKVALFFVLFIAVAGILAGLYFYNLKHTDMSKAKPDFVLTSSAVQKEFEENETTSSAKYINKILEITGSIISVSTGKDNSATVSLKTDNDMSSVSCTFPAVSDPSAFKPGDNITLRGQCSGFLIDVQMFKCALDKTK